MEGILFIRDLLDLVLLLFYQFLKRLYFLAEVVILGLEINEENRLLNCGFVLP